MQPLDYNPAVPYLPLLTHSDITVQRHAWAILLGAYGNHALTLLRRCLSSPEAHVRQQAHLALQHLTHLTDVPIHTRPFTGVYIESLGRLRLFVDHQEVRLDAWVRHEYSSVGWQKLQGMLGYLLHCGRQGTTIAALEAAVWGKRRAATTGRTLQALRNLLASLRDTAFADQALIVADNHCLLNPETYRSDVQAFEETFALATHTEASEGLAAATPVYMQALHLYGGPYLIDLPNSAPWAHSRRDHLRGNFLIAAERVAEARYTDGRLAECVALCSQIFDSDESADEVVAWLLRAYHRLGQTGILEHTYRRYLLANDLDAQGLEGRQDVVVMTYAELCGNS
ncbi:MAG: AfsR/SARP family transcriptional regulator [Chloroflexaceae bacterium]